MKGVGSDAMDDDRVGQQRITLKNLNPVHFFICFFLPFVASARLDSVRVL